MSMLTKLVIELITSQAGSDRPLRQYGTGCSPARQPVAVLAIPLLVERRFRMPDATRISAEILLNIMEVRLLLEKALDFEMPAGASARIRQAMVRVQRVNAAATEVVDQQIAQVLTDTPHDSGRARRLYRH